MTKLTGVLAPRLTESSDAPSITELTVRSRTGQFSCILISMNEAFPNPNLPAELIDGWVDPEFHRSPSVRTEALLASMAIPDELPSEIWTDPVDRDRIIDIIEDKARARGLELPSADLF